MKQIRMGFLLIVSLVMFIVGFGSMSLNSVSVAWASSYEIQEQKWAGQRMWVYLEGGIKFYDKDHYLENEWLHDGESWYYFDANGFILRNAITPDGYYVGNAGAMLTNVTLEDGRVVGADGRIVQVQVENWQWVLEGETWYYRDLNSGRNWTGWLFEGGHWYWLESDGKMATGFLRLNENGKDVLYYLNDGSLDYRRWTSLDMNGKRINEKLPYGAMLSNGTITLMGDLAKQIMNEYQDIFKREIGEDWWLYERDLVGSMLMPEFDENGRFIYRIDDYFNDIIPNSPIIAR